jgi:hypothetical protein
VPQTHESIRALLQVEKEDDPVAAIRVRARALVSRARALGWEGPPFSMIDLASLQRLNVEASNQLSARQDACVVPGRVLVNSRNHRFRQRYSIAHEVAHTLFPDYEAEISRVGTLWRQIGGDSEFERLCETAAAELLFPLESFGIAMAKLGEPTLRGALCLSEAFEASIEATTRRAVETTSGAVIAVFLRALDSTTGGRIDLRTAQGHSPYAPLCISRVYPSDSCGAVHMSRGGYPPKGGAANRAWKRVSMAHGQVVVERSSNENWEHVGLAGTWRGEAITLPLRAAIPHEVLCLLCSP